MEKAQKTETIKKFARKETDTGSTEGYALSPPILAVGRYPFLAGQFCTVLYLGNVNRE